MPLRHDFRASCLNIQGFLGEQRKTSRKHSLPRGPPRQALMLGAGLARGWRQGVLKVLLLLHWAAGSTPTSSELDSGKSLL